jgi:hypothetical protein
MFKIAGVFVQHYDLLLRLFSEGTSCGGLRSSIQKDFASDTAVLQFCALTLIGQMITSPWLKCFYKNAEEQHTYAQAILIVKSVLAELKEINNPLELLDRTSDFLGNPLPKDIPQVRLHSAGVDESKLKKLLERLLSVCETVIERQYGELLTTEVDAQFVEQTQSARTHNIIAEEIVGMFSAAKERSPHATTDYLSSRIRFAKYFSVQTES